MGHHLSNQIRKVIVHERTAWQSRIVGHGQEDPARLVPNELNWRRHPAGQRKALTEVMDRVGWVQDIIVNRRSGRLVDGHLRLTLALERGEAGRSSRLC